MPVRCETSVRVKSSPLAAGLAARFLGALFGARFDALGAFLFAGGAFLADFRPLFLVAFFGLPDRLRTTLFLAISGLLDS
jgi:hypothetical protein